MVKLAPFGHALANILYTDRCNVYRYESTLDADGATIRQRSAIPVLSDVKCRLSFSDSVDKGNVRSPEQLFMNKSVHIYLLPIYTALTGDYYEVFRCDDDGNIVETLVGNIGEPSVYPSHIKASFQVDEVK